MVSIEGEGRSEDEVICDKTMEDGMGSAKEGPLAGKRVRGEQIKEKNSKWPLQMTSQNDISKWKAMEVA